ncbi:MAG: HNH endonuclease [bacterium]
MEEQQRERARKRYGLCCGYCGVHEDGTGATLTIDHYRPRSCGGGDDDENLVYCCPKCNEHKGPYWHETDPPNICLLHPHYDDMTAHLHEDEGGQLAGLTPRGAFFVQRLRLNRPQLVAYRFRLRVEQKLHDEVDVLRQRVHELQRQVTELNEKIEFTSTEIEREGP